MYKLYAKVVGGNIEALNIKRGSVFGGKKLGRISPDITYMKHDLYPIFGDVPPCDLSTHVLVGPQYVYRSTIKKVERVYSCRIKTPEEIAHDQSEHKYCNNEEVFLNIRTLERKQHRALRELALPSSTEAVKNAATIRLVEIDAEIKTLRLQIINGG